MSLTAFACSAANEVEEVGIIYLKAFISSSESGQEELRATRDGLQDLQSTPRAIETARALLCESFKSQYIDGDGSGALRISSFEVLESIVHALGTSDERLIGMMKSSNAPGAWRQVGDFRSYLKGKLEKRSSSANAQRDVVLNMANNLEREAFLLELCPSEWNPTVVEHFHKNLWEPTPASGMDARLDESDTWNAWPAYIKVAKSEINQMANRLFSVVVTEWPRTGKSLERLVRASSHQPSQWHVKISGALRTRSVTRSDELGTTLNRITAMQASATAAMGNFDCRRDSNWLLWLHQQRSVQQAFQIEGGDVEMTAMIDHLCGLVANPSEFESFYPFVKGYYYENKGPKVFTDILRPHARTDQKQRIIGDALSGDFVPDHRAILGVDLLVTPDGRLLDVPKLMEATWQASPSRLDHAVSLYVALVPNYNLTRSFAQNELDRPLLGHILRAVLAVFRTREPAKMETARGILQALSPHLLALKKAGGNPQESRALRELNEEVLRILRESRDSLRVLRGKDTDAAMEEAVTRYVSSLKLALEFYQLLASTFETTTPPWLEEAAKDLRTSVFRLPESTGKDEVLYWPETEARFRARMLITLDLQLREALSSTNLMMRSGHLFWNAVYLPLLRVHGFSTLLGTPSPHQRWIEALGSDRSRKIEAVEQALAMLGTKRFLDADELLLQLAKLRIALLHPGKNAWQVEPKELFGEAWKGANANVRLLRSLLEDSQPVEMDSTLQLQNILEKVLNDLAKNPPCVGPKFPRGQDNVPDEQESIATYLPFTGNLVEANEWRVSPLIERGVRIGWTSLVKATPKQAPLPFSFTLPGLAAGRVKVQGGPRKKLVDLWLSVAHADEAAHAAMFLPNDPENIAEPGRAQEYLASRQASYTLLVKKWEATRDPETLRLLMRLSMSARTPLTPSYESIRKALDQNGYDLRLISITRAGTATDPRTALPVEPATAIPAPSASKEPAPLPPTVDAKPKTVTEELQNAGKSLVIVALLDGTLRIRIFDANGNKVADRPESELVNGQDLKDLNDLKDLLHSLPSPFASTLSQEQKWTISNKAMSIAGFTCLGSSPGGWRIQETLRDIDAEQVDIEKLMEQTGNDPKTRARSLIDSSAAAVLPKEWLAAKAADQSRLIGSEFAQRLRVLSVNSMKRMLKFRSWLRVLGDWTEAQPEVKLATEDGTRVMRFLSYLDYVLWYSRPDFTGDDYLFGVPTEETSKDLWYPALVMFSVADASATSSAMSATTGEQREDLKRLSILLDDAAFRLLRRISTNDEAQAMLDFDHTVKWTTCDFRLLFERNYEEQANAKSLTKQALEGVLRNYELSGEDLLANPSDHRVYARLFERMDECLPLDWQRINEPVNQVTLDGAIALAAEWVDGSKPVVPKLKAGAQEFLRFGDNQRRLLRGAKTMGGVYRALETLATKRFAEVPSKSYQSFYTNVFFDRGASVTFSEGLYKDLAEPLLKLDEIKQREDFAGLVTSSDVLFNTPTVAKLDFGAAWKAALPAAIEPLVKGFFDREGKAEHAKVYLWKPADDLMAQTGVQNGEPVTFLEFVKWWSDFEKNVKTEELKELFNVVDPKLGMQNAPKSTGKL